ncbi:hypothetical protein Nepgr_025605 [Nepenthes gracilis]|uniref:Uncharacterized protein n=1 Tax=Nepenthes gracilis TaxID=150966 RepID=A0AAD3T851_NEPGR|nr:hypothetical protein Nepgr_025605 [Nepenthes gracilis]
MFFSISRPQRRQSSSVVHQSSVHRISVRCCDSIIVASSPLVDRKSLYFLFVDWKSPVVNCKSHRSSSEEPRSLYSIVIIRTSVPVPALPFAIDAIAIVSRKITTTIE